MQLNAHVRFDGERHRSAAQQTRNTIAPGILTRLRLKEKLGAYFPANFVAYTSMPAVALLGPPDRLGPGRTSQVVAFVPTRVPRVYPDLVGRSPQSSPQSSQSFPGVSAIFEQMTSGLTGHILYWDSQDSNHSGLQRQLRLHGHQWHGIIMLGTMGPAIETYTSRPQKPHARPRPERYEISSENKSPREAWSVVGWCAKRMISVSSDVDEMTCMSSKS